MNTEQFSDLHQYALTEAGRKILEAGVGSVKVLNHVGVIQTRSGLTLEILPKLYEQDAGGTSLTECRSILIGMLKTLSVFKDYRIFASAHLRTTRFPLFELFISMFLDEVEAIVHRGLRSDYVNREESLNCLKGKLQVARQLRENLIHKERFAVAYQDFIPDTPENQLVKAALLFTSRVTRSVDSASRIRNLLFILEEVDAGGDPDHLWSRIVFTRMNDYYLRALQWAMIFLRGKSFTSTTGKSIAFSLLYPMERVFEDYVFLYLKRSGTFSEIIRQSTKHFLTDEILLHDGRLPMFQLRPDIVALGEGGSVRFILDTKWKLLDGANRKENYGISQADMYQLLSYGAVYRSAEPGKDVRLMLLYPRTESFQSPIEFRYRVGDALPMTVMPFDLKASLEGDYDPFSSPGSEHS